MEDWAVAQIMPGPNVVNLSLMIGARHFGLRGALVAMAGMLAAPLAVVLGLALLHARFADSPQLAGALRGMGAVAAGLIIATGLKLMPTCAPIRWACRPARCWPCQLRRHCRAALAAAGGAAGAGRAVVPADLGPAGARP